MVSVGDSLPSVLLQEGAPDQTVDLSKELRDGVVVGVPAAFSPTCSQGHIPKYISSPNVKVSGDIFVVSVNDVFVMEAWKKSLDPSGASGVRFLADPAGEWTKKAGLSFDATGLLGNERSKRYAMKVKGGKVEKLEVEEDPTKVTVSSADKILV